MSFFQASHRQWIMRVVRLLIVALVVYGIWRTVDKAQADFRRHAFSVSDVNAYWLVAAVGLYAVGMLPMGWFWYQVLWAMGQKPRLFETMRAFYIGHLGKYLPGKAMVVVLRAGMIGGGRVDTTVAAVSVFVETLTMMAVGSFLAAVILAWQFREHTELLVLAVLLMAGAGLPTLPPIFRRLVRLARVPRNRPHVEQALAGLNYRLMAVGWLCNLAGWPLFGLSLWATLRAMPGVEQQLAGGIWTWGPLLTATVCLAMVAGFASLLPGGIGVRELVLTKLMTPQFGVAVPLVSAVLLRLAWLVSELAVSVILYGWGRCLSARRPIPLGDQRASDA